jgi:hypothetical protein
MATLGMPNWEDMCIKKDLEGITPTSLGGAHIKFRFPEGTRFPCLPTRTDNGLIYPLEGDTHAPWQEILLADQLGAKIEILQGVFVPQDFSVHPFEIFSKRVQAQRNLYEKGTLLEQFWKELGNATYGKTCQGLRKKQMFSTRKDEYQDLPESVITNPFLASAITGFVRAVLGECLAKIPAYACVSNATTDGILVNL